ncbi:ABC transporter substrate-binding protein [Azoarcus olearius]|uniref:Conserved hypothetical secreted protein n=1 Tax=Azoarcus sp. (strain BH72) TaxID=418699 RepID=A1KB47_AZOSB|nr:ABC transporter substrate binding protein [Azoarcus olearius]CAL96053.1 conserved hypothetical secreted protein [Azoarcus olearius]
MMLRALAPLRWCVVALLVALALPVAAAQRVVIVTSTAEGVHAEAAATLRSLIESAMPSLGVEVRGWENASAASFTDARIVVTVGTQAARVVAHLGIAQPLLHILLPASSFEKLPPPRGSPVSAIYLDQPPERQLALIRLALPDWKRIAILSSPGGDRSMRRLAELARERQMEVREATIAADRDLYTALQQVLGDPAVLVATPDPQVFNSYTVQNVLLTAYRQRSPVVGFSSSYVRAGALFALYSTPAQIATQASDVVFRVVRGEPLPPPRPPRQFEVAVNTNVARSLGIPLESGERLTAELQRLEGGTP